MGHLNNAVKFDIFTVWHNVLETTICEILSVIDTNDLVPQLSVNKNLIIAADAAIISMTLFYCPGSMLLACSPSCPKTPPD